VTGTTLPPTARGERTRRAVLDAAVERFGRDGYRATAVADVARDAGVGGTVPYAYFPSKEALFLAAVDDDAAAVIAEGTAHLAGEPLRWRSTLLPALLGALDRHPLARRLLAGLEPEVTARVLEVPALAELRRTIAERLAAEQRAGTVRADVDPVTLGNGLVTIVLALLMAVTQLGPDVATRYADDVGALLDAALTRPATPRRR